MFSCIWERAKFRAQHNHSYLDFNSGAASPSPGIRLLEARLKSSALRLISSQSPPICLHFPDVASYIECRCVSRLEAMALKRSAVRFRRSPPFRRSRFDFRQNGSFSSAPSAAGFPHSGRTERGRSPHSPPGARSRSSRRRRFGVLPLRRSAQQGPGLLGQEGPAGTIDAQNEGPSPTAGASSHRLLIRRPWFQSIPRSPPWPPQHSCRRCRSPSSDHSHSAR